jgi:membrane protease YdiL (CAAX protease family)
VSYSVATTRQKLRFYYLAVPFAIGVVLLLPYRELVLRAGCLWLYPIYVALAHLHCGLSYVITGFSLRKGYGLLRSSLEVYGSFASITHLQAAFLVALAEEVVFRYAALSWMAEALASPGLALVLVSAVFSIAHVRRKGLRIGAIPAYVDLFLFGCLLGGLTLATGSLYPAILLHCMRNYILRCLLVSKEEYEQAHKSAPAD